MFWNVWNWEIGCLVFGIFGSFFLEFLEFLDFVEFSEFSEFLDLGDGVFSFGIFGIETVT